MLKSPRESITVRSDEIENSLEQGTAPGTRMRTYTIELSSHAFNATPNLELQRSARPMFFRRPSLNLLARMSESYPRSKLAVPKTPNRSNRADDFEPVSVSDSAECDVEMASVVWLDNEQVE